MRNTFTLITLVALGILFLANTNFTPTGDVINLNQLENYANQNIPGYITKDNTPLTNPITDEGATLGRVLFYDKKLSINNTISCGSCHLQEFAFGDPAQLSTGHNGATTGRHAMRLINVRFADEVQFFWDERASTLEEQTTQPIQDHIEMGFSGVNEGPDMDSLLNKMIELDYYQELFNFVYGDPQITEQRIQLALAQFIRSIQSFDSKFDVGRAQVAGTNMPFPNFSEQENLGKQLFMTIPLEGNGGAGCNGCHRAPEFDIAPDSRNNGIIGVANNPEAIDLNNTRSPSLRDLINPNGIFNGPFMHNGEQTNLLSIINHYNEIEVDPQNTNLDPRLNGGPIAGSGEGQNLNLTTLEKAALISFLVTLSGTDVYSNPKWSDPFDANGELNIIGICDAVTTNLSISICEGDTYNGHSISGNYINNFTTTDGCDSIVSLDLTVIPNVIEELFIEICEGASFEGYTQTGLYQDTLTASTTCDSIRIINLTVLANTLETSAATICEGHVFEGYTATGTYQDIFTASNGCDSIRTLILSVIPTVETELNIEICAGESFEDYTMSGTYEDVFIGSTTCDSIRILNLTVLEALTESITTSICTGNTFEGYTTSGTYEDIFTASNGCDSTRILELFVSSMVQTELYIEICEGEIYEGYTTSGTYIDTYISDNGCDSVRMLELIVLEPSINYLERSICEGDSYGGYDSEGVYEDVFTGTNGCDSIQILTLSIDSTLEESIPVTICAGELYEGYTMTGIYEDTFISTAGCDSIRILELNVIEAVSENLYITICEGEEYDDYSLSGIYQDVYTSSSGCDSIQNLTLEVLPTSSEVVAVEICDGEEYDSYTTSGIYEDIFIAENGCDSVRLLDLLVLPLNAPACITSSVENPENKVLISVFPNPFQDYVQLNCACNGPFAYNLYDALGTRVRAGLLNFDLGTSSISTDALIPGVYLLQLTNEEAPPVLLYIIKH